MLCFIVVESGPKNEQVTFPFTSGKGQVGNLEFGVLLLYGGIASSLHFPGKRRRGVSSFLETVNG